MRSEINLSLSPQVNFFVGAFYDGVYLLGIALNETLADGGDIRDGISITRRMWDRDFIGITGHVRIDDNGDRDADYSILDLDPITGRSLKIQIIRSARLYPCVNEINNNTCRKLRFYYSSA